MNELSQPRVSRRNVLKYGGISAVSACLAGCQSADDGESGQVGDASGNLPLSGQTITVGSLAPDLDWPLGEDTRNGAELAVSQINQDGGLVEDGTDSAGILGAEVRHAGRDTNLAPAQARRKFTELVRRENVNMTTGIFLDDCLMSIFPEMARTKTIHITAGAPDPRAGRLVADQYDRFKYHFRTGAINGFNFGRFLTDLVEQYAETLRWNKIALLVENLAPLHPTYEYMAEGNFDTPPFSGYTDRKLADVDGVDEVVMMEQTSSGTTNWSPIWDQVEEADADLALIAFALTGTPAVNQWANEQRDFEMGGIHLFAQDPNYWDELDGRCEYVWTGNAYTPQTKNTNQTTPYVQAYFDMHGQTPLYPGGIAYDAIMMYCQAVVNAVKEEDFTEIPHSDAVVPYLERLKWPHGTIYRGEEWGFMSKDHPSQAHDAIWHPGSSDVFGHQDELWAETVPVMQQWQYDPDVREGYGTQHSFAPWQNRSADYKVPDWIDKEPDGDRWLPEGRYEDEVPIFDFDITTE